MQRYFIEQSTLLDYANNNAASSAYTAYWIGFNRATASSAWTSTDGSITLQPDQLNLYSSPYARWLPEWFIADMHGSSTRHCLMAAGKDGGHTPYDHFLGSSTSNATELATLSLYQTQGGDVLYGWGNGECNSGTELHRAICKVSSSGWPCLPPPIWPPPPPKPPSPPYPPTPPTCELQTLPALSVMAMHMDSDGPGGGSCGLCICSCQPASCIPCCQLHAEMLAAAAGVPPYNTTYFCDARATNCYVVLGTTQTHDSARIECIALGGELVMYVGANARAEQQMVSGRRDGACCI